MKLKTAKRYESHRMGKTVTDFLADPVSTNLASLSLIRPPHLRSQCLRTSRADVCSEEQPPACCDVYLVRGLCWAWNLQASSSPSWITCPTPHCSRSLALDFPPQARFHSLVFLSNPYQNLFSASCHLGNTSSRKLSPSTTQSSGLFVTQFHSRSLPKNCS